MMSCNLLIPQLFWIKKCRENPFIIVGVCILVNVGMWFERFVIIATSLSRSFVPSNWNYFSPTKWDIMTLAGSFGLFFTLFLLFFRYLPVIAMSEVKMVSPAAHAGKDDH
jgi:molybdopterin-containing oxidoreductase family membrane subunit